MILFTSAYFFSIDLSSGELRSASWLNPGRDRSDALFGRFAAERILVGKIRVVRKPINSVFNEKY